MADYCTIEGCSNGRYFDYDHCLRHLEEIYGRGALLAPIPESGAGRAMVPGVGNIASILVRPPIAASPVPHRDTEKTHPISITVATPEGDEGAKPERPDFTGTWTPPTTADSVVERSPDPMEQQPSYRPPSKSESPTTTNPTMSRSMTSESQYQGSWLEGIMDGVHLSTGNPSRQWFMLFAILTLVLSVVTLVDLSPASQWSWTLLALHVFAVCASITVLAWTEHFPIDAENGPRDSFGRDPLWWGLNLIPILIWGLVLLGLNMGSIAPIPEGSVLEELLDPQTVGAPLSVDLLGSGSEEIYWLLLVSHVLFFMSVQISGLHVGRIRTQWTISLACSLFLLASSSFASTPREAIEVMTAFNSLLLLSGSCVWLYGRSRRSISANLLVILLPVIVSTSWIGGGSVSDASYYQIFLLLPIMVLLVLLTAGWISSRPDDGPAIATRVGGFVLLSGIVFLQMTFEPVPGVEPNALLFLSALLIAMSAVEFRREHFRNIQKRTNRILAILDRRSIKPEESHRTFIADIKVFGTSASGKSTFLTSLWTTLKDPRVRGIWWGSDLDEQIRDLIEGNPTADLKELCKFDRSEIEPINLIELRSSKETCNEWREEGKLPKDDSIFPFIASSTGEHQDYLDSWKAMVTAPEERHRILGDATKKHKEIFLDLEFHAKIRTSSKDFFFSKGHESPSERPVKVRIRTFDHPGEAFRVGVLFLRNLEGAKLLEAFESGRWNTALIDQLNDTISRSAKDGKKSSADPGDIRAAALEVLLSMSVIYMVDADSLTGGGSDVQRDAEDSSDVQRDAEDFLYMLEKNKRSKISRLEALQVCLNRADTLLPRPSSKTVIRNQRALLPKAWADLNDKEAAFQLMDRSTNHHLENLKLRGVRVEVRHTCNLGGIVSSSEIDPDTEKPIEKPPYPMLPVNVMESLLDVLFNSKLRSPGE